MSAPRHDRPGDDTTHPAVQLAAAVGVVALAVIALIVHLLRSGAAT